MSRENNLKNRGDEKLSVAWIWIVGG